MNSPSTVTASKLWTAVVSGFFCAAVGGVALVIGLASEDGAGLALVIMGYGLIIMGSVSFQIGLMALAVMYGIGAAGLGANTAVGAHAPRPPAYPAATNPSPAVPGSQSQKADAPGASQLVIRDVAPSGGSGLGETIMLVVGIAILACGAIVVALFMM